LAKVQEIHTKCINWPFSAVDAGVVLGTAGCGATSVGQTLYQKLFAVGRSRPWLKAHHADTAPSLSLTNAGDVGGSLCPLVRQAEGQKRRNEEQASPRKLSVGGKRNAGERPS